MDYANYQEDMLLGSTFPVEDIADFLEQLAESEYGRLKHFKVVRPQGDPEAQIRITVENNGALVGEWMDIRIPEKMTVAWSWSPRRASWWPTQREQPRRCRMRLGRWPPPLLRVVRLEGGWRRQKLRVHSRWQSAGWRRPRGRQRGRRRGTWR